MRGHDFWTPLKMCVVIFDLLPTVLESGTVTGEIASQVALMPMVIEFGSHD